MHREFLAMMLYLFAVFSVGFPFCRVPGMRFDEAFDRGISAFSVDCQMHKHGSFTFFVDLVPPNVKQQSECPCHKCTEQATDNLLFDAFFCIFGQNKNPRKFVIYRDLLLFSVLSQRKVRDSNPRNLAVQRFSRPPRSTTPPTFRRKSNIVFPFCQIFIPNFSYPVSRIGKIPGVFFSLFKKYLSLSAG